MDPYFLKLLHACSSRCVPTPVSTWNFRIFLCLPRVCQSELAPWQHPLLVVRLTKPFRTYLHLTILCVIVTQVSQVISPYCQGDTVNELIAKGSRRCHAGPGCPWPRPTSAPSDYLWTMCFQTSWRLTLLISTLIGPVVWVEREKKLNMKSFLQRGGRHWYHRTLTYRGTILVLCCSGLAALRKNDATC